MEPGFMNSAVPPILVTGSHNSGTTWVGRMLAASRSVAYIHEPFNVGHRRPGICTDTFHRWFTYVCVDNESHYRGDIERLVMLSYPLHRAISSVRSARDAARVIRDFSFFARHRLKNSTPLLKDPIALLSAPWLAETFSAKVVVLIRHPAAFVNSITRRGWAFPFRDFLDQPLLMRDYLSPFEGQIRRQLSHPADAVEQASLLWAILYSVVDEYQRSHEDWIFLRHEDAAVSPVATFESLYTRLGLPFDESAQSVITAHTVPGLNDKGMGDSNDVRRDSAVAANAWKTNLDRATIERIWDICGPVASRFYGSDEW